MGSVCIDRVWKTETNSILYVTLTNSNALL